LLLAVGCGSSVLVVAVRLLLYSGGSCPPPLATALFWPSASGCSCSVLVIVDLLAVLLLLVHLLAACQHCICIFC